MAFFKKLNGFTLIEVLVALVILSISLLALAGLMVTTTRNNASGGHLTEAATFAQDTLERLRQSPIRESPSGAILLNSPVTDSVVSTSTGITYTRSWIAVPNIPAPNNTLDTITITVSWTDPAKNQPHTITMVTTIPL